MGYKDGSVCETIEAKLEQREVNLDFLKDSVYSIKHFFFQPRYASLSKKFLRLGLA
jgi:hypothetical protein